MDATPVTHYRVSDSVFASLRYVECRLETGRTHQIRVHMASLSDHPLLGDRGLRTRPNVRLPDLTGQTLHAGILGIVHPRTGEYMEFTAPPARIF